MTKVLFTLNIGDYAPEIRQYTYPLIRYYADKIGAEFVEITERKFPEWPIVCEKLQMHALAHEIGADWNIYFDADTLIHPEMIDWSAYIPTDTVANNGNDMGAIRWRYDDYFLRDGRNIGTCGWCWFVPKWCVDVWRPCDDMTPQQVAASCYPTVEEMNCGVVDRAHLTDDFIASRNVARFGLKYTTIREIEQKLFPNGSNFLWHVYTVPVDEKVRQIRTILDGWRIPSAMLTGADLSWRVE